MSLLLSLSEIIRAQNIKASCTQHFMWTRACSRNCLWHTHRPQTNKQPKTNMWIIIAPSG